MQLDLPDWFFDALPRLHCRKCKEGVDVDHVLASGIRKSVVDIDTTAFFIEYKCPYCKTHTTMELSPMTMEELVMEMFDKYTNLGIMEQDESGSIAEQERPTCSSKISKLELANAVTMVRECETHHDFMLQIGMTEDQIKEYSSAEDKNIHNHNRGGHENN